MATPFHASYSPDQPHWDPEGNAAFLTGDSHGVQLSPGTSRSQQQWASLTQLGNDSGELYTHELGSFAAVGPFDFGASSSPVFSFEAPYDAVPELSSDLETQGSSQHRSSLQSLTPPQPGGSLSTAGTSAYRHHPPSPLGFGDETSYYKNSARQQLPSPITPSFASNGTFDYDAPTHAPSFLATDPSYAFSSSARQSDSSVHLASSSGSYPNLQQAGGDQPMLRYPRDQNTIEWVHDPSLDQFPPADMAYSMNTPSVLVPSLAEPRTQRTSFSQSSSVQPSFDFYGSFVEYDGLSGQASYSNSPSVPNLAEVAAGTTRSPTRRRTRDPRATHGAPPRSSSYPSLSYAASSVAQRPTSPPSSASSTFNSPDAYQKVALPTGEVGHHSSFTPYRRPPAHSRNSSGPPAASSSSTGLGFQTHLRAQSYNDVRSLSQSITSTTRSSHTSRKYHGDSDALRAVSRRTSTESMWSETSTNPSPVGLRTPASSAEWEKGLEGLSLQKEEASTFDTALMEGIINYGVGTSSLFDGDQDLEVLLSATNQPGEGLQHSIKRYLDASNRLELGERTVLVLSPRVVTRSYGNEKRFLCPQPMALLLGTSWWSRVEKSVVNKPISSAVELTHERDTAPPDVFITMSTDTTAPHLTADAALIEWMAPNGDKYSRSTAKAEDNGRVVSGRASGKSTYVSSPSAVRALVTVLAPGTKQEEERCIGTFPGKPMTVISKPSKRRQAVNSAMALHHGGLVSLYNRTKSQTGSTRFLGVSGMTSSFPAMDWRAMTGGLPRSYAPSDAFTTTFVARTGSWDPFVVYAVDLDLPTLDASVLPAPAPHPGFPRPPVNAIPFDPAANKGIYYNMPIVLQCLATAVVSPVMIIRKVDGKSSAIGGGATDGFVPTEAQHLPCAPGERLAEPVSQFRPLALEVYNGPGKPTDAFLACLGESIGINQSRESRVPLPPLDQSSTASSVESQPTSPVFPTLPLTPTSDGGFPRSEPSAASVMPTAPEFEGQDAYILEDHSSNGTKVKKLRRLSSTNSIHNPYPAASSTNLPRPAGTLSKHKRRGLSLSSLTSLTTEPAMEQAAPPRWSVECGEACVWTVTAIDINRHTFYVPPDVQGGKHFGPPSFSADVDPVLKTPVPAHPIRVGIPIVLDYEPPVRGTGRETGAPEDAMIQLHGDHFSNTFTVWLGSSPCPQQLVVSSKIMFIVPPAPSYASEPTRAGEASRISFVRNDGVVFPSNLFYRDS